MKSGDKYFVRIDRKVEARERDDSTLDRHFAWVKDLASRTELYGGGFAGAPGMLVFRAESYEVADATCKADPIIAGGYYEYELHEWEIQIASNPS